MRLYTCPAGKRGASGVLIVKHPCGRAAKALDEAGHAYELQRVGGFKGLPWTRRGQREEIRDLTGQEDVPVLLLDDGSTVVGSGAIVAWAREHPAQPGGE
ncbi:MAG TPA: glutathione S-transferase N-terminal domain-containing protein [Baekduia sp.]|nr:glutathione S-transferase N-terminal domain-containing protein [Baekduia sp.]